MSGVSPHIQTAAPVNFLNKPLTVDFKALFKSIGKLAIHGAQLKVADSLGDAVEAFASLGFKTDAGELAYVLIQRALFKAVSDLATESSRLLLPDSSYNEDRILDSLDLNASLIGVAVDAEFLSHPESIGVVPIARDLLERWLILHAVSPINAASISKRLPGYFVYALNQDWRSNAAKYKPLSEGLQTPFSKAGERTWAWAAYAALLEKSTQEGVFDEPFSLRQLYIPLNAVVSIKSAAYEAFTKSSMTRIADQKTVVAVHEELYQWLKTSGDEDSLRVISGGPGSGKSTVARIFAADTAAEGYWRVLYIPLHLIEAKGDFVSEVGSFVRREGILPENPLESGSREPRLFVLLDGLDELASQGKSSAQTARDFVSEVKATVLQLNNDSHQVRVLFCGRELVVQEAESEFRKSRQVLTLQPYFSGERDSTLWDRDGLLTVDLRERWWRQYGEFTGRPYSSLPEDLNRDDLAEITAQPLLNYLLALSFMRGKLDFSTGVSLNAIYADLIAAVYERAYEKQRTWKPISHMSSEDFSRVLEEIGLAAWHGDGRTTTVKAIQERCEESGLGKLLTEFKEGAEAGVTRLLAAFFFRRQGVNAEGDSTFVFTHKSFGEYLAAKRIFVAVETIMEEMDRRAQRPGKGWDEKASLKHWLEICSPSPMTTYIHNFLIKECMMKDPGVMRQFQDRFAALFSYNLNFGPPVEQLKPVPFQEMLVLARNAEEALLAALNAFAQVTGETSQIKPATSSIFGAWLKRIQGQRVDETSPLVASCLSHLNLEGAYLHTGDFNGANLMRTNLRDAKLVAASFVDASLRGADLSEALLSCAVFVDADLHDINLSGASLDHANLFVRGSIEAEFTVETFDHLHAPKEIKALFKKSKESQPTAVNGNGNGNGTVDEAFASGELTTDLRPSEPQGDAGVEDTPGFFLLTPSPEVV